MIAAHYETLRMAALGEALPTQARSGLMLFLRRGMWGWARTLAAPGASQLPIRPPSSSSGAAHEHEGRGIVHVLAALAMNAAHSGKRGAP